jgi:hypothetical protein
MGLFSKSQPPEEPPAPPGGEALIRAGLKVRTSKRENLIGLSRKLEIPHDALLAFTSGESNMNADALSVIAEFLWANKSYDEATDMVVSKSGPATSMGERPVALPNGLAGVYPPPATPHAGFAPPAQMPGFADPSKYVKPSGYA